MQNLKQIGTVEEVNEIVCLIRGLPHVGMEEQIVFESGVKGMILRLDEDYVYGVLLGDESSVKRGDQVMGTGKPVSIPIGDQMLGRVVNPLGVPVDGKAGFDTSVVYPIEREAPNIFARKPIKQQLETGVMLIDGMLPLGKGQRETIIGDPKSGKSNAVYTTILNSARADVLSVYVTIGKSQSKTKAFVQRLTEEGLLDHVVIVMGTASMTPTLNYVAPYAGTSIAEYFMEQGRDVLIIYDDLSQHAKFYRQISLLLKRSPGREAYPGDIFFIHSRLLERAAALTDERGGGTLTALPIIEIKERDLTGYVPTNVLSITDGHILFDIGLFNQNIIPSVALELSVSRLGGKVQSDALKKLGVKISHELMQYREALAFAHFGTDLASETAKKIERGKRIIEFLKQGPYQAENLKNQIIYLHGLTKGYFDKVDLKKVKELKPKLIEFFQQAGKKEIYDDVMNISFKDLTEKMTPIFDELAKGLIKENEIEEKKPVAPVKTPEQVEAAANEEAEKEETKDKKGKKSKKDKKKEKADKKKKDKKGKKQAPENREANETTNPNDPASALKDGLASEEKANEQPAEPLKESPANENAATT